MALQSLDPPPPQKPTGYATASDRKCIYHLITISSPSSWCTLFHLEEVHCEECGGSGCEGELVLPLLSLSPSLTCVSWVLVLVFLTKIDVFSRHNILDKLCACGGKVDIGNLFCSSLLVQPEKMLYKLFYSVRNREFVFKYIVYGYSRVPDRVLYPGTEVRSFCPYSLLEG